MAAVRGEGRVLRWEGGGGGGGGTLMLFMLHTCLQWIFVCGYNYIYKRKGKEATERNPEGREEEGREGRREGGKEGGMERRGRGQVSKHHSVRNAGRDIIVVWPHHNYWLTNKGYVHVH